MSIMGFLQKVLEKDSYVYGFLLVIALLAFGNVLRGDFFLDDMFLIVNNEYIKSFAYFGDWFTSSTTEGAGHVSNLYRPVQTVVNAVMFMIFGLSSFAYHLLNIVIHSVNGFLVYRLFGKISFSQMASFLMAILFVLHPVQVESVSYIAGLPDVLMPLFLLLGLNMYVKDDRWSLKRGVWLSVIFVLGFLSKESMVVFFPLALLIDIFRWDAYEVGEKNVRKRMLGVLLGLTVLFVILKFTVFSFTGNLGLSKESNLYTENLYIRLFTFISILLEYVKLIFWPVDLYFEKSKELYSSLSTWQGMTGLLIVFGGLAGAVFSYMRRKVFFLGYFWFFLALLPVCGLIPQNAMYTEHWLYVPLIGLLMFFAGCYDDLSERLKKVFVVAVLVISLLFGWRVMERNVEWADPFMFFENELKYNEASHEIYNKVGTLYFEDKQYSLAMENFEKAIQLSDTNAEARFNMCLTFYLQGVFDQALPHCLRAIEIDPVLPDAYMLLYNMYVTTGQEERAQEVLEVLKSIGVELPG